MTSKSPWRLLTLVLFILAPFVPQVSAQLVSGQAGSAAMQMIYTTWSLTADQDSPSLDQFVFPVSATLPLREKMDLRVQAAAASNTVDMQDGSASLSGLTDMKMQVSGSLSDDRYLWSVGANLPTGKKSLDLGEEWRVMNFLAQDFLTLPNRGLGGSPGFSLLFGRAVVKGLYRFGASVSYRYSGSYESFQDNGDYNPGEMFNLFLGGQKIKNFTTWTASLSLSSYSDDTLDGLKQYNRGRQGILHFGFSQRPESHSVRGNIYISLRGKSDIYDVSEVLDSQLKLYGNEVLMTGQYLFYSADHAWSYGPTVDIRFIAANDYGLDTAKSLGVGAKISKDIHARYRVGLSAKVFTGNADGGAIDLSGAQIASTLEWSF